MSKIVNPGDRPVPVARWIISPKGSKAVHSLTGQEVEQLPEQVAKTPIVQSLVARGILEDSEVEKATPAPERVRAPEESKPHLLVKKHKRM